MGKIENFDIIISGAGIAGLCSALTSVNAGFKTAMIEKQDSIGGTAKDCFHNYICGLFKNSETNPFEIANPGLCPKVFKFLHDIYGSKSLVKFGKVETIAFIQKDLWNFFEQNLNKKNFYLFKNMKSIQYTSKDKNIQNLKVQDNRGSKKELFADVFVNTTGNLNFYESMPEIEHKQLGGYCILLKGNMDQTLALTVPYNAQKIIKKHKLAHHLQFITISDNMLDDTVVLKFSVKSSKEIEICHFVYKKLCEQIESLTNLKFIKDSKNIHFRTSDRFFTGNNLSQKENCKNPVVKSYWPSEKWDMQKGTQYSYIKDDTPFLIDALALKSEKFHNLFFAGKNIGVSEHVQASARVMGVCMATGEQAALAAIKAVTALKHLKKS